MSTQFENPPIVELIAEVRWHMLGSQDITEAQAGVPITFQPGQNAAVESFLSRFGVLCNALGFRNSERLVPAGIPTMPGQPVYRYTSSDIEGILVQAGWGVATINALPPYKSWSDFAPKLKDVLKALITARGDNLNPFYAASIRYIDAFGPEYIGESSASAFARDVLGFDVALPPAIESERDPADPPAMSFQITFPTSNGLRARIVVAEGQANDVQALIFDTTLGTVEPINPNAEDTFKVLDDAHTVIHRMFEGVTDKIRPLMRPLPGA